MISKTIRSRVLRSILGVGLLATVTAQAAPARFGLSPDNAQSFLIDTIQRAERELVINIYEFKSPPLRDAVLKAISRGVKIRILVEGDPVGGLSSEGYAVYAKLIAAMKAQPKGGHEAYLMTKGAQDSSVRRFVFNHAKYAVIDGKTVYMASENFSPGAHPKMGYKGNRGWHVAVDDAQLASQMLKLWSADADPSERDVIDVLKERLPGVAGEVSDRAGELRKNTPIPAGVGQVASAKYFVSPRSDDELVGFMRSARKNLELNFMSLPYTWKTSQQQSTVSALVQGLIDMAKSGVRVRALLNDDNAFSSASEETSPRSPKARIGGGSDAAPRKNLETVCRLREAALSGLQIEGRIVNIKAVGITYIHNKGMLADGKRALVSSINGTQNSVMNNRETALVLESPDAAAYYGKAFNSDWGLSDVVTAADCKGLTAQLRQERLSRPYALMEGLF